MSVDYWLLALGLGIWGLLALIEHDLRPLGHPHTWFVATMIAMGLVCVLLAVVP